MGGPAASILLRRVLDEGQICAFKTWLREAAEFYDGSQDNPLQDGWEYFLRWPAELGEEPSGRPCLGGIQMYRIDPELDSSGECGFSPADWARYREALGWMPGCELSVGINCNRPRDHRGLAWHCAELATRFCGVIDMGGQLPLPDAAVWSSCGLQGSAIEIAYSIDETRFGKVHVVDVDFLRSWILRPNFHMIK